MTTNTHFDYISLISSYIEIWFSQNLYRKPKHILYLVTFFNFENRAVYEMMWKNIVEPSMPQMTI